MRVRFWARVWVVVCVRCAVQHRMHTHQQLSAVWLTPAGVARLQRSRAARDCRGPRVCQQVRAPHATVRPNELSLAGVRVRRSCCRWRRNCTC